VTNVSNKVQVGQICIYCHFNINNSERPRIRKVQVHPNDVKLSEPERINHDAAYLFHANKYSNSKTSSLSQIPQNESMLYTFLSKD
jgi:hypothetical protein